MKKLIHSAFLTFMLLACHVTANAATQPLSVDDAFQFSATAKDAQTAIGMWKIAPGYYLYKSRIHFKVIKPESTQLGDLLFPATEHMKEYPGLGKLAVFTGDLQITVPVLSSESDTLILAVSYQGCSEAGYCYPPTTKVVSINLAGEFMAPVYPLSIDIAPNSSQNHAQPSNAPAQQNTILGILGGGDWPLILLSFFGFGLLISFTPCVLPMIPILSGIILGQKKLTHSRSFGLSAAYVLGMAITYAIAGVLFGLIGGSIQPFFQIPWVIGLFSAIFVGMALSLFGLYNIQLPEKFRSRIASTSNHQKHGTYAGTFIMGCLSTLILSPCVTAPLVGVLSYISQTGNAKLGGIALFIMGIGMGVPLLIIGASSAKLLPKAGAWMNAIKNILGVLLLGIAIWMLARVLPGQVSMVLWGILAIGSGIALKALSSTSSWKQLCEKLLGIVFFIYGLLLLLGAIAGNTNPLQPISLTSISGQTEKSNELPFITVASLAQAQQQLAIAKKSNQPAVLDFYADWCVACKEMDTFTFTDTKVKAALSQFRLIRVDVTSNDRAVKQLLKHYSVVAPPTLLFFNNQGQETTKARIVGSLNAKDFLQHLSSMRK